MGQEILPFLLDVPEAQLADLRQRLRQTRWPAAEPVSGELRAFFRLVRL